MKYHVYGTVDDDQLLSLRFGDAAKEQIRSVDENYLCDVFWHGDMSVALIEAFSRGNRSVDFTMVVEPEPGLRLWVWEVEADGWKLDPREIVAHLPSNQLVAAPIVICEHNMELALRKADTTPVT